MQMSRKTGGIFIFLCIICKKSRLLLAALKKKWHPRTAGMPCKVQMVLLEVCNAVFKDLLILVAGNVLADIRADTLAVTHLAQDSAVR